MKVGEEGSAIDAPSTGYRSERLKFQLRQLRKQWKIYYRSAYGKVGFYILVAFAVITLLSPVLTFHNPNTFFAPQEDAFVASIEMNAHVFNSPSWNVSQYPPAASALTTTGSYVVYAGTPSGNEYAVGLGGGGGPSLGQVMPILNLSVGSGSAYAPLVFPLNSYQRFVQSGFNAVSYNNFMAVVTTNGTIRIGQITWPGKDIPGTGVPFLTNNQTYYANVNVVLPPVSNALSTTYGIPPWVPFDSTQIIPLGFSNGQIYLITEVNSSYYIHAYNDYPLSPAWSQKLNGTALPSVPYIMGSFYENPDQASLLIEQGSVLSSYNPYSGKLMWQSDIGTTLNTNVGIYIPYGYQLGYNPFNKFYVSSGNSVYMVNAIHGNYTTIASALTTVTGLSSSPAIAEPNPSYFAVQTSSSLFIKNGLSNYSQISGPINLTSGQGSYTYSPIFNGNTRTFVAGTNLGNFISIAPSTKQLVITWHVEYADISGGAHVSPPLLMINSRTGSQSFGFMSSDGNAVVYSTSGHSINPFPPTLHSPSGNIYLLGTNTEGQDVWSQLIASFLPDWEVGIGVAVVTIIISVAAAMVVGYMGGFVGSLVETISLTIFLVPFLALLIVMAAILSPTLEVAILILAAVAWPFVTFTLVGLVRQIKAHSYIEAAKISGAKSPQILRRHMLNNMTPLLAYLTAIQIGAAVATISTLQFLGVVSITTVTWGAMLSPVLNNFYFAAIAPWWILPPSICLTVFIFAFVFVSRGLDEVVNPRLRRR